MERIMNIETLIAAANPVLTASAPQADSPQAQRILTQILDPGQVHHAPRRRLPGGPASRVLSLSAVGIGAAAAAAALVVTQLLPGPGQPGNHPSSPLAAALDALASTAAAQPPVLPPGPGQFQYTDSVALNWVDTFNSPAKSYSVSYAERRQIWIASNGSGRIVQAYSDPDLGSAKDVAGWVAAGRPSLRIPRTDSRYGPHQLSLGPRGLAGLPTNTQALARLVFAGRIDGGPISSAEDFVRIGDLMRETDASPALRAAIFKVAQLIPGAKLLGTVTDQRGRRGIAIAHLQAFPRRAQIVKSVLIFDHKTSALLAEESLVTDTRTGKTALTAWTDYLKFGVVGSITSTTPLAPGAKGASGSA
jgi:hypothetical protein